MEAAASKAQDPTAVGNMARVLTAVDRVRQAEGRIDVISMDEPLCSTIRGLFDRDAGQIADPARVGDLARYTADYVGVVRAAGLRIGLIEAYPYHPAERIQGFVHDIVEANGQTLDYLEIDLDPNAMHDHKISQSTVVSGLRLLAATCNRYGMQFRAIVTAQRPHDDSTYASEALAHCRWLRTLIRFDGYTVQSWHENENDHTRRIPCNFPTHLDLVRAVVAFDGGEHAEFTSR